MFGEIAAILSGLTFIIIIVGLIKPNWVLFGNITKSRAKVMLIYGVILILGIFMQVLGAPSAFETGQKAFSEKNYSSAIMQLERVNENDQHYPEAQALLKQAKSLLWPAKLEQAKTAYANQNYSEVATLLAEYPDQETGFKEANKLLKQAKEYLAVEEQKLQDEKEAQQLQRDEAKEAKRIEKERKKAMADYPACDSEEATTDVADAMQNAPLGRIHGLTVIKLKNVQELDISPIERHCRADAMMNNSQIYSIDYSFTHDGDDVLIQAQVHGLE